MNLIPLLIHLSFLLSYTLQTFQTKVYQLTYQNSRYYIGFNLGSKKTLIKLAIDTSINTSLINSINCNICQNSKGNKYDIQSSTDSKALSEEMTYQKMRHVYTGIKYQDSYEIKDTNNEHVLNSYLSFISTSNVSLTSEVIGAGIISLNYHSDFINSHDKKIFILYLGDNSGTISVGEIDPEVVNITKLVYYPMTIDDKEHLWYLTSDKLTITRPFEGLREYNEQHKLMIDSNTWEFHIPKDFFYANIDTILPMQCQISKNDIFYCSCLNEQQKDLFPTFNFTIGGNDISMGPHQYLSYSSSNNYCIAHFSINYYSEYWIIGINLLNEHNTIFDFENKQIAFYDKTYPNNKNQTGTFLTIFLSVGISSSLILFGGYYIYKRYHPILNE